MFDSSILISIIIFGEKSVSFEWAGSEDSEVSFGCRRLLEIRSQSLGEISRKMQIRESFSQEGLPEPLGDCLHPELAFEWLFFVLILSTCVRNSSSCPRLLSLRGSRLLS